MSGRQRNDYDIDTRGRAEARWSDAPTDQPDEYYTAEGKKKLQSVVHIPPQVKRLSSDISPAEMQRSAKVQAVPYSLREDKESYDVKVEREMKDYERKNKVPDPAVRTYIFPHKIDIAACHAKGYRVVNEHGEEDKLHQNYAYAGTATAWPAWNVRGGLFTGRPLLSYEKANSKGEEEFFMIFHDCVITVPEAQKDTYSQMMELIRAHAAFHWPTTRLDIAYLARCALVPIQDDRLRPLKRLHDRDATILRDYRDGYGLLYELLGADNPGTFEWPASHYYHAHIKKAGKFDYPSQTHKLNTKALEWDREAECKRMGIPFRRTESPKKKSRRGPRQF